MSKDIMGMPKMISQTFSSKIIQNNEPINSSRVSWERWRANKIKERYRNISKYVKKSQQSSSKLHVYKKLNHRDNSVNEEDKC